MRRKLSREEVCKKVDELGVEFIHLQFTDIFGVMKNVSIPREGLQEALDNEKMFDGSSIDGFARIEESDMNLRPYLSSFTIYPWSGEYLEARLICDVYNPDGTPFESDPRYILKKALKHAEEMGYGFNVGPECEFYLFLTNDRGESTTITHDNAGYFDLAPVDLGETARRDMVMTLKKMGFEIEASHHEGGPGQHEIDFKYDNALAAADDIMTFKMVIRMVAQRNGLHATFMPKPVYGIPGSGMHTNMSLTKNGKNVFYDPDGELELSSCAYYFMGGLMKHAKALCAITNPTVNSYKRLVSGYEAPVYIAWSSRNRSPLIRVPDKRGAATRLELRNPDPTCNPYLALAVILEAGLDGIENKILPPEAVNRNIYDMTTTELDGFNIDRLPATLEKALLELNKDEVIKNALSPHTVERFISAKMEEWNQYKTYVTQWELDRYLTKY